MIVVAAIVAAVRKIAGQAASGFSMETYDDLMKGTQYGPMVIAGDSAGSNMLASTPMMAMTTSNSIKVKPLRLRRIGFPS